MAWFSTLSSRPGWAAGIAVAVLCASTPAHAWTGRVTWTTWLRAGPGGQYIVVDEVSGGQTLWVTGCNESWCQTISDGVVSYIQADLISKADAETAAPATARGCFNSRVAGYGKGEIYRFCAR